MATQKMTLIAVVMVLLVATASAARDTGALCVTILSLRDLQHFLWTLHIQLLSSYYTGRGPCGAVCKCIFGCPKSIIVVIGTAFLALYLVPYCAQDSLQWGVPCRLISITAERKEGLQSCLCNGAGMGRELKQATPLPTIPAGTLPIVAALPPIATIPAIPNSSNDPFLSAISRIIDFLNRDIANLQVKPCLHMNLLLHSPSCQECRPQYFHFCDCLLWLPLNAVQNHNTLGNSFTDNAFLLWDRLSLVVRHQDWMPQCQQQCSRSRWVSIASYRLERLEDKTQVAAALQHLPSLQEF